MNLGVGYCKSFQMPADASASKLFECSLHRTWAHVQGERQCELDQASPSLSKARIWARSLTLAEVNPKRADDLFKRGLSFGQSRVICNAHWQSDVDAGRIMGAATVAKLHSNPEFLADVQAARKELESANRPSVDCTVEEQALSEQMQ
ncbi:hypothetical protein WH300_04390 [Brucella anthropi]|nr:hypothetical protein [Ochrobactrum sp. MYb49]